MTSQRIFTAPHSLRVFGRWWGFDEVPLELMWQDDQLWLPKLLGGEDVSGAFVFEDQVTIQQHEVRALPGGSYEPAAHDFELGGGDGVQVLGEKN